METQIQKWNDDLYAVTREEYASFVRGIKSEFRDIRNAGNESGDVLVEIWSKKTGKRLCGRKTNPITEAPEQYYIWDIPDPDETQEPKVRRKVELQTPQQVQAVLDYIRSHQK